ncbi:MAG: threonine/serine dehydratase [Gemmatimonadetes bacterium]|nr:threonine/serine dehydratase [Gemmatimonadota bacterium]
MPDLVTPQSIQDAAQRLRGVAIRTPLLPAHWLQQELVGEIRLKCENLQRAGAFKIRGAYTMLSRLPEEARRRGVITYSSGNHGQAMALAGRLFGVPAVVVMPTTAPAVKVEGVRRLGAEIVFEGTTSLERQARAEAIATERGLTIVPPFDHPDIIAGQGTVGLEILEDWPEVDGVLVPIGGGGLISGVAAWLKRARPQCALIGVEPAAADAMRRSLAAGKPVTIPAAPTIADGLAPVRPGDLTFAHARALVDEVVTVEDAEIAAATRRLLWDGKLVCEPSGAATLAALLSRAWWPRGRRSVAVLSGGNLDSNRLAELTAA